MRQRSTPVMLTLLFFVLACSQPLSVAPENSSMAMAPDPNGPDPISFEIVHPARLGPGSWVRFCKPVTDRLGLTEGWFLDVSGGRDASEVLQRCIDNSRAGDTILLPGGTLLVARQLVISAQSSGITIRTYRHFTQSPEAPALCVDGAGKRTALDCAILKAAPQLYARHGLLVVGPGAHDVILSDLILDGNRIGRVDTAAAAACFCGSSDALANPAAAGVCHGWLSGEERWIGENAAVIDATRVTFARVVSENALCSSALNVMGYETKQVSVVHGAFLNNGTAPTFLPDGNGGYHYLGDRADAMTLMQSQGIVIEHNLILDQTDLGIAVGGTGGVPSSISDNLIVVDEAGHPFYPQAVAMGGIGLNRFGPRESDADDRNLVISGNTILCNFHCIVGLSLGNDLWNVPWGNSYGFTAVGNTLQGASLVGLSVGGAGTANNPARVTGNRYRGPLPGSQLNPLKSRCASFLPAAFSVGVDGSVDFSGNVVEGADGNPRAATPVRQESRGCI